MVFSSSTELMHEEYIIDLTGPHKYNCEVSDWESLLAKQPALASQSGSPDACYSNDLKLGLNSA